MTYSLNSTSLSPGICATCRKTIRALAEDTKEKETTAPQPGNFEFTVDEEMEKLTLVSFYRLTLLTFSIETGKKGAQMAEAANARSSPLSLFTFLCLLHKIILITSNFSVKVSAGAR